MGSGRFAAFVAPIDDGQPPAARRRRAPDAMTEH